MFDAAADEHAWAVYVRDMIEACERVIAYTDGLDQAAFLADRRTYDATLRNVGIVGEAARRIPESVHDSHTQIPWRAIIGARNRVIHAYMGLDDVIWSIVSDDIPRLVPLLEALLGTLEHDSGRGT